MADLSHQSSFAVFGANNIRCLCVLAFNSIHHLFERQANGKILLWTGGTWWCALLRGDGLFRLLFAMHAISTVRPHVSLFPQLLLVTTRHAGERKEQGRARMKLSFEISLENYTWKMWKWSFRARLPWKAGRERCENEAFVSCGSCDRGGCDWWRQWWVIVVVEDMIVVVVLKVASFPCEENECPRISHDCAIFESVRQYLIPCWKTIRIQWNK